MRIVQFKILRNILNNIEIPDYIYAFEKGKSIPEMAAQHVGKDIIVSMDIKDFFPSITQVKVQSLFAEYGLDNTAARVLSEICTYGPRLPQGALTSPKISNIIASRTFGPEIKEYCDEKGLTLTIYADDITVSCNGRMDVQDFIAFTQASLHKAGFRVNFKKTKIMPRYVRQYVCGVVVNDKPNMVKKDRYILKSVVDRLLKNGIHAVAEAQNLDTETLLSQVKGRLNWLNQLNPLFAGKVLRKLAIAEEAYKASTGSNVEDLPNVVPTTIAAMNAA